MGELLTQRSPKEMSAMQGCARGVPGRPTPEGEPVARRGCASFRVRKWDFVTAKDVSQPRLQGRES